MWKEMTPEIANAILDKIDVGLPNGRRYSASPQAKERAAWRVVLEHLPALTEKQAREIVKTWVKKGVIETIANITTRHSGKNASELCQPGQTPHLIR
jgi:hypothetical protein